MLTKKLKAHQMISELVPGVYIEVGDFEGSIDEIIKRVESFKQQGEAAGYTDICVEMRSYGYDGGMEASLKGKRLETDKERDTRVKILEKKEAVRKKQKSKTEEQERKQYERLKAKFGEG